MKTNLKNAFLLCLLTTITAFSTSTVGFAQPVLNGYPANNLIGSTFKVARFGANSFNPGASGANVTWDFSSLQKDSTTSKEIVDPSTTPYASDFDDANICYKNSDGKYYYYSMGTDKYEYLGSFDGNYTFIGDAQDHQLLLKFPFTYESDFTDDFTNEYDFFGLTYHRFGTITGEADGYGTLKLPYGTLEGVLRVKWVEQFTDSNQFLGNVQGEITTYVWYVPDHPHNVFAYIEATYNGQVETYGAYLEDFPTAIASYAEENQQVLLYPNPVDNQLTIRLEQAATEDIELTIHSLLGSRVFKSTMRPSDSYTLDLGDLNTGTYVITLQGSGQYLKKQFMKY